MIEIVQGDLLKSDCNIIVHQCNCFATQGAGIAKQISTRWPEVLQADKDYPIAIGSEERLGKYSMAAVDGEHGQVLVVNMYGQHRYGRGVQTDYNALETALDTMFFFLLMVSHRNLKVGLPYGMGAGLAGGDWNTIEQLLREKTIRYKIPVYIYKLT